jgi:long-chain acyl-CoA synthetase
MHTLAYPLRHAVLTGRDRLAAVCGSERYTYAETWSRCRRLVGGLLSLGLSPGDRVALLAANCHRYVETYQAVPAGGLVIVPLNTRHAERELAYALDDSGARLLITDRDPGGLASMVERVIVLPEEYEELLADATAADLEDRVSEADVAGLFYTGGTTGAAKGVMLTHRNLMANTLHVLVQMRFTGDDRYLIMAPLFHAAGSMGILSLVWRGGLHVMLPSFDPVQALDMIEDERITATLGVPTMVAAMADEQLARPRDVSSLRCFGHGGSPIATETIQRAHLAFPSAELQHLYGATETGPLATGLGHEETLVDTPRIRSCGTPVVGVEVRIVDEDGHDLAPGQVGEVIIRGPNIMKGYWNKPAETAAVLRQGWYRSGDLGYLDEGAFLYLVDRKKDMIVTGGENVYSTEVEDALYFHPAVQEAAVFGIPHPRWGEAVHAVVVLREPVDVDMLITHCRDRIAGYKVPKTIDVRTEPLPKSGPGKILKRELREPFWAGQQTRIAGG